MSSVSKIFSNTTYQILGRLTTALLAIISISLLTRFLGKSGYGQYVFIYEILAFAGAFADFGIFTIVVREIAKNPEKEKTIFGNALSLRILSAFSFMFIISLIFFLIPKYQGTVVPIGLSIAAMATFFIILSGTISAILQIRMKMGLFALSLVLGKIISVSLIFIIINYFHYLNFEKIFYLIIFSGLIGSFFTFLLAFLLTKKIFNITLLWNLKEVIKILKEAMPFGLALAINVAYLKIDIILMSILLPNSVDEICSSNFCGDIENGKYGLTVRIIDILLMVPIYFMNSILPMLSNAIDRNKEKVSEILKNSFQTLLILGLSASFMLYLLSKEIVLVLSGESFLTNESFYGSDFSLKILSFFIPMAFISILFSFAIIAHGKQKYLIMINTMAVLFNIIANLFLIPRYGMIGAGISTVISEFIMLGSMIFFAFFIIKIRFQPKNILKIIISLLFSFLFTFLFKVLFDKFDMNLIIKLGFIGSFYLVILILFLERFKIFNLGILFNKK